MKTKLNKKTTAETIDCGRGAGHIDTIEYECPCGKGRIIEEHDFLPCPGSRYSDTF